VGFNSVSGCGYASILSHASASDGGVPSLVMTAVPDDYLPSEVEFKLLRSGHASLSLSGPDISLHSLGIQDVVSVEADAVYTQSLQ
ncbi:hypothetical protein KIPB_017298, partial [Kipferlia bialata]